MPPFVDRDLAEQRYPHGTRARYHLGKCRCEDCRRAVRDYERERQAERRKPWQARYSPTANLYVVRNGETGEIVFRTPNRAAAKRRKRALNEAEYCEADNELISTDEVRAHCAWLQAQGVGLKTVAKRAGISYSVLQRIVGLWGRPIARTRYATAEKILGVGKRAIEGGARVEAAETIELLDRLIAAGYKKFWIAKELGAKGERPGLQVGRNRRFVSVRNARKVHALYVRLQQADKRLAWISEQYSPAPAEHSVRRARRSGRAA